MLTYTRTRIEPSGALAVLRFEGDITSASERAVLGAYKRLPPDVVTIVMDFTRVGYLNSTGISLLIRVLRASTRASQQVACFGLTPHFNKLFTMVGLARYIAIHSDEASARVAAG